MNNQQPSSVIGAPLDVEFLLELATIDELDLEAAAEWWDTYASISWVGALDVEPIGE